MLDFLLNFFIVFVLVSAFLGAGLQLLMGAVYVVVEVVDFILSLIK